MTRRPSKLTQTVALTCCLSILLAGCQASQLKKSTLPTYKPEPLPAPIEEREADALPKKSGNPPVGVLKDAPAPFSGVLMDGHLAAKYKLIKAERDRLRRLIDIDRTAYTKSHAVTSAAFDEMAERAKRSWWENNKGTVGFWGGMVMGMGLSILAVYGINQASK